MESATRGLRARFLTLTRPCAVLKRTCVPSKSTHTGVTCGAPGAGPEGAQEAAHALHRVLEEQAALAARRRRPDGQVAPVVERGAEAGGPADGRLLGLAQQRGARRDRLRGREPRGHPEDDRVLERGRLRGPPGPRPGRGLPSPGNEDRV